MASQSLEKWKVSSDGFRGVIVLAGLLTGLLLGGCAGAQLVPQATWKEEVLLHDGRTIFVERSQSYGGRSAPGQPAPIREHRIRFQLPDSGRTVEWTSPYGEDLGRTTFNLLAVHVKDDTAYVVASPNLCLSYNKWGRPNPPYVIFEHDAGQWRRTPLETLPPEFKTTNVLRSIQRFEAEKWVALGIVSSSQVADFNGGGVVPEFRQILRTPLSQEYIEEMCEERVFYRGYWILPNDSVARQIIDKKQ